MIYENLKDFLLREGNFATLCLACLVTWLFMTWSGIRIKSNKLPPGPFGLPFFGVLSLMTDRPDKKVMEWARKYGDVMTLWFLNNKVVVVSSMEALTEGLVQKGDDYASRPWCFLHDRVWMRNGISVTNVCPQWKEQRKFSLVSLRKFGFGRRDLVEKIVEEADHFNEALLKAGGDFANARELLTELTANIMLQLTLGRRCDNQHDANFIKFFRNVSKRFDEASFAIQATIFVPWLHHLPPFRSVLRRLKGLFVELHEALRDEIKSHQNSFNSTDIRDFTDDYTREIEKRKSQDDQGLFSNEMLMYILRDFFLAGTETSATTLTWALLILANRKDTVLKKVQEEINRVVGMEGAPNLEHRDIMHYTNAFLQEVMRYRTVLPFSIARMTSCDTKLRQYEIPKETTVLQNVYAVHNDPHTWKDPEVFRVERHLDEGGKFVRSPNVIPFGVGTRYCVGKQLANMEMFIVLVRILQRFHLVSEALQDESISRIGFIAMAPFDTRITFVERK